jgi:hypothetical protein
VAEPLSKNVSSKDSITSSSLPPLTPKVDDDKDAKHGDTTGTSATSDSSTTPSVKPEAGVATTATNQESPQATKEKDIPSSQQASAAPKVAATDAAPFQKDETVKDGASVHDAVEKPTKATSSPAGTSTKTASSTTVAQQPEVPPLAAEQPEASTSTPAQEKEQETPTAAAVARRAEEDGAKGTA